MLSLHSTGMPTKTGSVVEHAYACKLMWYKWAHSYTGRGGRGVSVCTNLCEAGYGWFTRLDCSPGTHAWESHHGILTGTLRSRDLSYFKEITREGHSGTASLPVSSESRSSVCVEEEKPRSWELAYPIPTLGCRAGRQPERKQKRKSRR